MAGLSTLTQAQLEQWVVQSRAAISTGRLPEYIPMLAKVNPAWVAVQAQHINGYSWAAGEIHQPFVLMSVVKPFLLLFLLEQLGSQKVFTRVGMDLSAQSFHSLTQLQEDKGFPRNPMINSGAIALADLLPGNTGTTRCETLRQWLNQVSGSQLRLDEQILASVRSLPNEANRALATLMAKSGYLDSVETALDTYNQICCLSGTVEDLAKLGVLLAGGRRNREDAETGRRGNMETWGHGDTETRGREDESINSKLKTQNSKLSLTPHPSPLTPHLLSTVNALMLTCGLYETSGRFAVRIGLPTKSGVSGAMVSVVPGQGAIACYSPAIDSAGNSVAGLFLLECITQTLNLSVFS